VFAFCVCAYAILYVHMRLYSHTYMRTNRDLLRRSSHGPWPSLVCKHQHVCMYACMYMYVYIYIYIYIYIRTHTHTHTHTDLISSPRSFSHCTYTYIHSNTGAYLRQPAASPQGMGLWSKHPHANLSRHLRHWHILFRRTSAMPQLHSWHLLQYQKCKDMHPLCSRQLFEFRSHAVFIVPCWYIRKQNRSLCLRQLPCFDSPVQARLNICQQLY
jgi:hypothetical protein